MAERKMKDSGVEWIGKIPEEWKILRYKNVMHKDKDLCEKYNGEPVISLTMGGVIIRDLEAGGKMPATFDGYQYVEPGDLLQCLFDIDVTPRCVGLVKDFGVTSPAYSRFIVHKNSCAAFYDYQLRAIDDQKVFVHLSKNLRSSLTETDFGALYTVAPPLVEQQRIADFLDQKCSAIDDVLAKTRESIEEYKKLKQAVITEAVTKGVRGKRPMKDSGIPWFGMIPSEVAVSKVGRHYDITLGKMLCDSPKSEDMIQIPYICAANVHFDGVDVTELKQMWFSPVEIEMYQVCNGDLLIVEGGAGAGGCAIAENIESVVGIQNSIQIIRSKDCKDNRYLCYALQSLVKNGYMDVACNKATLPHYTKDKLSNTPYLVWSLEEQQEIADYLNKKCAAIDTLIAKKQQFIEELTAYKKSLIYEYVTGKKEVPA